MKARVVVCAVMLVAICGCRGKIADSGSGSRRGDDVDAVWE